ncbi:elongation of very long chain fatty acids protein 4-like isoform X1 [Leptopilina boulardi]|uniref:elongation of very long chain fatty acids protein 4-like isoform X1 n=1 Tax=Leptopilina boulardi TaxID=63433 RepID=UPI0021F53645|nr:elongation of very long chain fatty acids protein 4-like isoform X1 [Leptopilina boulardi]
MGLLETFNYYYYDLADQRIRDWFLMNSIWYPIIITLIYILMVFKLAPAYMKNRPAYKLNTYIKCYNLFQVFSNAYIAMEASLCYPFLRSFECRPIVYKTDPCSMMILKCGYIGMLLKLIDLTETVVYILRKKNNQVTFLHLYHHLSTFLIASIFPRYLSVDVVILGPILNCFVHVIMYFYYFLSNFTGPIKEMIIPFKRYMTLIQMGQFVIVLVQILVIMIPGCDKLPKFLIYTMFVNIIFNFCLFYRFYKDTYINIKKKN